MAEKTVLVNARLSPRIKSATKRQAKRDSLSFSDVIRVLLKAYAKGDIKIDVVAKQKGKISVQKKK